MPERRTRRRGSAPVEAALAKGAVPAAGRAVPLLERIAGVTDTLRPSEQAVARYVLRHANQVLSLSFPEIAERAGVSQPTVARFCRAVGFSGYREFKLRLAQSLAHGVPYVHAEVAPTDSGAAIGATIFDRAVAALLRARNHLQPVPLQRAIDLLAEARRIEFYGSGNSGIVAQDGQHKFFRLGAPVVAYADPHVYLMAASLLRAGDVLVVISGSGRNIDLLQAVAVAKEGGATVIALTASDSPLARAADVALHADVAEDLDTYAPMTSRLVHLTLLDTLAVGVAVRRGPALSAQLQRAKSAIAGRRTPGPER